MKTFKTFFRSIIKNEACVEGGRNGTWLIAIILFVVSVILSIIPITVTTMTSDAGQFVTNGAYDVDKGLYLSGLTLIENGNDLLFHNEKVDPLFEKGSQPYMTLKDDDAWPRDELTGGYAPISLTQIVTSDYSKTEDGKAIKPYEDIQVNYFDLYVFPNVKSLEITKDNPESWLGLSARIACILHNINPYDDLNAIAESEKIIAKQNTEITRQTSFAVFGLESYVIYKFNTEKKAVTTISGTYRFLENKTFTENIVVEDGYVKYNESILAFSKFLNNGYFEIRKANAGLQVGIYIGLNAGLILVMGLVLFLMTRGKQNPFRVYKITECMRISAWTAPTPALLAMVLGFLFNGQGLGSVLFIMTFGIRAMFLAMKQLRPIPQN